MAEPPEIVAEDDLKIIPDLHVVAEVPTEEVLAKVALLKQAIQNDPHFESSPELRVMYEDSALVRFLRARGGDVTKATELIREDIAWRSSFRPHEFRCNRIESQAVTGKMRVSDQLDCHGRPVIVMHHKYENSKDEVGQLEYLVWSLDHAIRRMSAPVSKYSVFINQEGFSLWNAPPMRVSKEVAKCLSGRYPERLGHAVIWQPPFYFRAFYTVISPFIDVRTKNKILMIHGEYGPGTKNDRIMTRVFGPNWKIICGIDQPQESSTTAPGYSHGTVWGKVRAFEEAYFSATTDEAKEAARVAVYGPPPVSPDSGVATAILAVRPVHSLPEISDEAKGESKSDQIAGPLATTETVADVASLAPAEAAPAAAGAEAPFENPTSSLLATSQPESEELPSGPL